MMKLITVLMLTVLTTICLLASCSAAQRLSWLGMRKQGKASEHWIDDFHYWLESQGLTRSLTEADAKS